MNKWMVMCLIALAFAGILTVSATITVAVFQDGVRSFVSAQTEHIQAQNKIAVQRAADEARLAAAKAERDEMFWRGVDGTLRAVTVGALWLGIIGVLVVLGWLTGRALLDVRNRRDLITVHGIPVGRQLAVDGATLGMAMTATMGHATSQVERARQPVLPATLRTYNHAPRIAEAKPHATLPMNNVSGAPELTVLPNMPRLLEAAQLAQPDEVVLGFAQDGKPRMLTLDALGATLIVGERGSGKSTTMASLAALCALNLNAALFVIDRHARLRDSFTERIKPLASLLAYPVAVTSSEAQSVLSIMENELRFREGGSLGKPFVLLVDEMADIFMDPDWEGVATQLGRLSKRLATAGRKMDLGIIGATQLSNKDSLGGHFAYTVATFIAHRCAPDLVRRFIGRDTAQKLMGLANGEVMARYMGTTEQLRVPEAGQEDLAQIGQLLDKRGYAVGHVKVANRDADDGAGWRTPNHNGLREEEPSEPPVLVETNQNWDVEPTWPIELRALTDTERAWVQRMHAAGLSLTKICHTVFGFKNGDAWSLITSALGE